MKTQSFFRLLICTCLPMWFCQVSAQEQDAVTKAKIAERDELRQQVLAAVNAGDLDEVIVLFERVYALEQSIFGGFHASLLDTLNKMVKVAKIQQDFAAVVRYRERQSIVTERLYGKDDYRTHDALRAVEDSKAEASRSSRDRARLRHTEELSNGVVTLWSAGDYRAAMPMAKQALEIRREVLGTDHLDYADSLSNLAALYVGISDYGLAEPLCREAMQIQKKVLGKQHPDYAISVGRLAGLYLNIGDSARAAPLCREAIQIQKHVLGKQHPDYATSLTVLADLYLSMGDYGGAEPLLREAMEIYRQLLGKQDRRYADTLRKLALLYQSTGEFARAETLCREAIQIQEQVHGKYHPEYAICLNQLGEVYRLMGDLARAEPLYVQSLAITEKVLGKEHSEYGTTLNNLGVLYATMGDHVRAESLYLQAVQIAQKQLGVLHSDYLTTLKNLAFLYDSMRDYDRAERLCRESVEASFQRMNVTAGVQSQRQQVVMGELLRPFLDEYLSVATRDSKYQTNAYAAVLQWKGSVWQRQQRQRLLVDQPALKPQFTELSRVSSRLSTLTLSPPNDSQQLEAWRRQLEELTLQREKVERDLSLASAEFQQTTVPVTPDQLRSSLPEGTVLLDFLEYNRFTPANQEQKTKDSWERHLLVHVVRADQPVRSIDLGAVDSLTDLVQTWRSDFGQSPAAVEAAQELRQQIWDPLQESLSGVTMVYVSPDGVLGQFPLGALPGTDPEKYLLEELAIVMLPVPQGLPAMLAESPPSADVTRDRFCLVGGVDYEQVSSAEDTPQPETPESSSALQMLAVRGSQHQQYGALPGTLAEVKTIESLIRQHRPSAQATILQGSLASESLFAEVATGHRYLHIATHGFFAPESVKNALAASSTDISRPASGSDPSSRRIVGSHPDLLSGLVFAGANQPTAIGEDDGILTAAEVQSLDLRGVELAILSACETGLGRTAGGEGIIGLQRAFQLSGAKTTITSLWQVDDAATQALMVEFYRNLFERKLSKLESLRQAQIWLLNHPSTIEGHDLSTRGSITKVKPLSSTPNPTRSLPAYWAAFQLSGDPR